MKARRVALLLAIVAVSALTLFLISLLDPPAARATGLIRSTQPDTLASYEETLSIGPDGNARVEISAVIEEGGSGDLLLPFDFEHGEDITILSGPARFRSDGDGPASPTTIILGRRMLDLVLTEDAAPADTVRVAAVIPGWFVGEDSRLPYGESLVERGFDNTSTYVMREFRLGVILPPGTVVHSIRRVAPAFDPKRNPKPPYAVERRDGRVHASVQVAGLAPADAAHLDLGIRPARRGPVPLVAGLLLALLYLVFFRDVLRPRAPEAS